MTTDEDTGGVAGPGGRERLQKVLARAGIGSRRVCEDLIDEGRITINGVVATLGDRVDPAVDAVDVDGVRVGIAPGLVYYLLNKAAGVVTTAADTHGRPTVVDVVPAEPRVFPVGRLDLETEGLLLLTNDGELTHRLTSGVVLLMTLATLILCSRAWPAGHRVRRAALVTMGFMLAEAGVGAAIVLLKKVGQDDSIGRAVIMALHLGNTFLLLASNFVAARWASGAPAVRLRGQGAPLVLLAVNLGLLLLLGASGAVTALGDTLFPARSLAEGIAQDLSPTAHVLIRLRVFHPLGAVLVGGFTAVVAVAVGFGRGAQARRAAVVVLGLFLTQITVGVVNLALLAPVWAQLVHLLLADAVWLSVVWLGMTALQPAALAEAQPSPKITTAT